MLKRLNITKEYMIDRTFDESFAQLDNIISASFNDFEYITFGNFISVDPPEFIFMIKWLSFGKPMIAKIASTKISVKLFAQENKSKISITTKTNPALFIFFSFLIMGFLVKLVTHETNSDITKLVISYFLLAIGTLALDRIIKKLLINNFERDMNIKNK